MWDLFQYISNALALRNLSQGSSKVLEEETLAFGTVLNIHSRSSLEYLGACKVIGEDHRLEIPMKGSEKVAYKGV